MARELPRLTPEAVQAIAAAEIRREQLRSRLGPSREERPHAFGIVPEVVVLLPDHRDDDLFGPARRLRRGRLSFTIHLPGLQSERPFSHPLPW